MNFTTFEFVLLGCLFMGVSSGLIGAFVVLKRMALVGDSLAHAVLPGVAAGFLLTGTRDPFVVLLCSMMAGFLSMTVVFLLEKSTRLGRETIIGISLVSFFSLGGVLFSWVEKIPNSDKSGLRHFLFGNASAMSPMDVGLLGVSTIVVVFSFVLFFKDWKLLTLDPDYAKVLKVPVSILNGWFSFLLTLHIVLSLQAVGVVLVSALLVIPAASAYLLSRKLLQMCLLSVFFAVSSAMFGTFSSAHLKGFSTGPLIALCASLIFFMVFVFQPLRGEWNRFREKFSLQPRLQRENSLKAIYKLMEIKEFKFDVFTLNEFAAFRNQTPDQVMGELSRLSHARYLSRMSDGMCYALTPLGWFESGRIVRNHRLWELYLHHFENIPTSEVHAEAEDMEHKLSEAVVIELEDRLKNARIDPHGRKIPSLLDMKEQLGREFADQTELTVHGFLKQETGVSWLSLKSFRKRFK